MDIKVIVAAHKKCWMPQDELYLPLHVGHAIAQESLGFQGDDTGDNISAKNASYCELTGIYWAWKNLKADYIGLVHYRRFLAGGTSTFFIRMLSDKRKAILTKKKAEEFLISADVLVPKKRRYYIETLYSHYEHTHDGRHLDWTGEIIAKKCPEYKEAFRRVLDRKGAHMFNMFIMKDDLFQAYCSWLFPILEELEGRIDTSQMTPYEARYVGRISELLLDVWLDQNHVSYREVPWIQLGKENWPKKIRSFLAAKFRNRKYGQSF